MSLCYAFQLLAAASVFYMNGETELTVVTYQLEVVSRGKVVQLGHHLRGAV